MNSAAQQPWSQTAERGDAMAQMSDDLDDFTNLFEFGDLDLDNIAAVDSAQYGPIGGAHSATSYTDLADGQVVPATSVQDFGNGRQEQYGASQKLDNPPPPHAFHPLPSSSGPYPADSMRQAAMPQQFAPGMAFPYHGKADFSSQQHVPPTPNSFDMHGQPGQFVAQSMDPQHRAMLEQRYQLRKDDAIAFTPMVSPAGTPQYNIQPEFTIPGAYFSPLTSPMLHAQNAQHQQHQQHQHGFYTGSSTGPSSSATSPLDPNLDVDMLGDEQVAQDGNAVRPRKSERRRGPTPRVAGDPLARIKQSPISKAVKRKSTSMLSSMTPLSEHGSNASQPTSAGPPSMHSHQDSTEDGSISPEPLSEALMGPPPRPGSAAAPSPALAGRQQVTSPAGPLGKAATPKSLLSMRGFQSVTQQSGQAVGQNADGTPAFEDIQLPEAAADNSTSRPALAQINTQVLPQSSSEETLVHASRKTPKLGPLSTPSSARPTSSSASPSTASTPIAASTPGVLLKSSKLEPRSGRGKKRGSMSANSSTLVSPALRPRISPSIKPLLPEGSSLNSQTHALLLASKSNYQNLLEGNHLPGVNYPDSLSTGLTSKRTSHKVAEQGRRNRINEALREMQSLLPKPVTPVKTKDTSASDGSPEATSSTPLASGDVEGKGGAADDGGAKSSNSKAATVESANEYIRKLQRENAALQTMKKEHEALKRRLASAGGSGNPGVIVEEDAMADENGESPGTSEGS